ncbi:glycosyltransferase family 4 protein [Caminibacter pacificus]
MSKTIWIINDYAGSAYHGMEFRNYYFAKEWVKRGYEVYIISASYMHLFKKLPETNGVFTFEKIDGINYVWTKVINYGKSDNKKRVFKWFEFAGKLFFLPFSKMKKPDVIIASPMAPFLVVPAYKLAKKFNAKFIYEVKDIWPLSIIELGNISPKHPLIKIMSWCEKFAVKNADFIVSSLQNYDEHLKEDLNIERDFVWINNGISLEEMQKIEPLPKQIEDIIPKNKFIIGYAGTVGIANALDSFLEAAQMLKYNNKIFFLIVGDGREKENLTKKYGYLKNVLFIPPVKKSQVQSLLNKFDVCYIGLQNQNLFKYGVSPNKLFDYMYSAKPIIYAINSGKNNIVKLANCGISVEAENSEGIKKAIINLYNMSEDDRKKLGANGKRYVLENFTYEKLAQKYERLFQ